MDQTPNNIEFAPGMRVIIRDEEWMVKKIEINNLGNKALHCVGVSPLVKDRESIFLTDLERITVVDPAKITLCTDDSQHYNRTKLYLVEIDILTAKMLGLTLNQLIAIYRIQFPVLQEQEEDTWYDANDRIVFTSGKIMIGFSRSEWEKIKNAPFDRCNRETDYETARNCFTQKYGTKN